jgi:hypothetical protein
MAEVTGRIEGTRVTGRVSLRTVGPKRREGTSRMTKDQHTQQDPTRQYPQPEFGEQQLEHPGLESEMQPKPDYGEETYRGSGKLTGKAAIITGGTQASVGLWPSPSPERGPTS